MSGLGVQVGTLPGWDVRVFRRAAAAQERTNTVVHAATVSLTGEVGDYGDGLVQRLTVNDVFIALVEFDPSAAMTPLFRAQGLPRALAPDDLARSALQHAVGSQSGVQRFFSEQQRAWCLYVVVGSHDRRGGLMSRANALLDTIEIGVGALP
jgi:hypothetical protein